MSEESFFREVDEEVRHEQFKKLWDKFGIYIIAGCVGIVAAVGGMKGWQAWQASRAESFGARYLAAMDLIADDKPEQAQNFLAELAEDGPDGYATLARFQQAELLASAGETAAARAVLDQVAGDGSAGRLMRELATVKSALLAVDTEDFSTIEAMLGSLATEPGPWLNAAREVLALSAYRAGDYERADRIYLDIRSDASAPGGLQERARRMQELIDPHLQELADQSAGDGGSGETAAQ